MLISHAHPQQWMAARHTCLTVFAYLHIKSLISGSTVTHYKEEQSEARPLMSFVFLDFNFQSLNVGKGMKNAPLCHTSLS